ncbi:hypothetical protein SAMN05216370_0917 [Pseudomonas peli]|uniref:Uncharacterized protein n=1 Tax=Pseudomonas peli TaxID=592361 RepID=A0AB37Z4Y9_9PSED|nr:hypothetical protein [Pseudomonas peli]NMZ68821.1 hypothetical protein [Pseudomonas peli]SCW39485.1 hypothetical protein SAMN05216370_0917 [Pseudomonas peli]
MSQNLLLTLATIAEKPNTTKRDALTITRRALRHICQQKAQIQAERRAMNRQARKLRQYLPFTAKAADDLEQRASDHHAEALAAFRRVLVAYGEVIIHDREGIAAALGFDQMADLLSINPAHREQARQDGGESLQGLAYIARMEDSAAGYGNQWGAGGPLYQACQAAMMDFIRTCPDHLLPDPFAPGAPFGPPIPPELRVV